MGEVRTHPTRGFGADLNSASCADDSERWIVTLSNWAIRFSTSRQGSQPEVNFGSQILGLPTRETTMYFLRVVELDCNKTVPLFEPLIFAENPSPE